MSKDIKPTNNKGRKHGLWEMCWNNNLGFKCFFHNGKYVGYEEFYWYNGGKLTKKTYNI